MYYHCRHLKHVEYGKVFPSPEPDPEFLPSYRWLGHYCGYCPQIWLSRGTIDMTGMRNVPFGKPPRDDRKKILFCFDVIKGFPVDHHIWCWHVLNGLMGMSGAGIVAMNRKLSECLDDSVRFFRAEFPEDVQGGRVPHVSAWLKSRDLDLFLKDNLFVERDQVVVPSLNLKAAKEVICWNERQKKALHRMGFIEDRITIRNFRKG